VFPLPPGALPGLDVVEIDPPPPDPPGDPDLCAVVQLIYEPPEPPPADVILEKTEFEPGFAG